MTARVVLIGAGGKMGTRLSNNLDKRAAEYELICCEKGASGLARLKDRGIAAVAAEEALPCADFAILAVPDAAMKTASAELVPQVRSGATVIMLDPAAAAAGEVTLREDLDFIVCHPCHPPLFGEQASDEARRDFFGGIAATQDIVIALMKGAESALAPADALCRTMFAPVTKSHRITVEQMAILEPAMAEVVAASAAVLMREALEEAVKAGVPREAATSFMLGHAQIPLAIAFGAVSSPFSDAAKIAIGYGQRMVYRSDWRKVFQPEHVRAAIQEMLHPEVKR